ncbi:hypothetical protein GCM10010512_32980 [Streptomyces thermoviolaceus subsp. thermoviolaceus]|nr:hypothetical protein GCM10010499_00420 [Streptomyces thermoviolaceus subsp. apingens]GHA98792.1 hypothetical protein GCM10010512_32980 [Streptomyces thermoviolaceus subsp. thermoviolaceus]
MPTATRPAPPGGGLATQVVALAGKSVTVPVRSPGHDAWGSECGEHHGSHPSDCGACLTGRTGCTGSPALFAHSIAKN